MTISCGDAATLADPHEVVPRTDAGAPPTAADMPDERGAFDRLVGSWDAHGDSHTGRVADGIAYSAYLRSIGLNDEASHLLRESAQNGEDDDDALGWLGLSGA